MHSWKEGGKVICALPPSDELRFGCSVAANEWH